MASGVGSGLKPGPICRPTNGGTDLRLVSSWRSSDVAGFRLADQPERRQVASLRLRASDSQVQEAEHRSIERKAGGLSRRSVLVIGAVTIQPILAWSANADAEELNESQRIFQAFLESVRERLRRKQAAAPTVSSPATLENAAVTPSSSEPESGEQAAPESTSQLPDAAVESATDSPAQSPETAAEASEPVERSDSESAQSTEAGGKFEPADVSAPAEPEGNIEPAAKGETAETSDPAGDAPSEEPVSASAESGEETKTTASASSEIASQQELVSSMAETRTVAAPSEDPAAGSSTREEFARADSTTNTSATFVEERAYEPVIF